jgi:hydrogenase maturation factor
MRLRNGKAGENTLDRSVFKRISGAGRKGSRITMSADPVTLGVSKIGELAVYAAINALCAEKILPESFRPVILLPVGTQEERLREIMDQICKVCTLEDLVIEGGHTEVTSAVTRSVVTAACTGYPVNDSKADLKTTEYIVMTKWAALEGTWLLASEMGERLRERFPERILETARSTRELLSVRREAEIAGGSIMVDLAEGGILAALWRLSAHMNKGFEVDLLAVPLLQETIEITNYLGINPYEMRSAGSLLIVTDDPDRMIELMETENIPAAVIGRMTGDRDKLLMIRDEKRYLDRPQADALWKVFETFKGGK